MLNEENLLAAGYKKFKDTWPRSGTHAEAVYQKRVWSADRDATEYFINVYHYKFDLPGHSHESWELNMAFERHSKLAPYAWVKYSLEVDTPVSMLELIAADLFVGNNGKSYDG
jgi:hypothetical protein